VGVLSSPKEMRPFLGEKTLGDAGGVGELAGLKILGEKGIGENELGEK